MRRKEIVESWHDVGGGCYSQPLMLLGQARLLRLRKSHFVLTLSERDPFRIIVLQTIEKESHEV